MRTLLGHSSSVARANVHVNDDGYVAITNEDGTVFTMNGAQGPQGPAGVILGNATSVLSHGADPTGVADSTAAFVAAFNTTVSGAKIVVPKGTYLLQPDHATFRFWQREWIGESVNGTFSEGTVIKPTGAGTSLGILPAMGIIRGIRFDADNLCQFGLYCSTAHASILENVYGLHALNAGICIKNSSLTARFIGGDLSRRGLLFQGINGSAIHWPIANNNDEEGMVIEGSFGDTPGLQAGNCLIEGGVVDVNCAADDTKSQILVDGVEQAILMGIYIEGVGDGVRVVNNSHNCEFIGLRFVGGSPWRAFDFQAGRGCAVIGCGAPGGDGYNSVIQTAKSDATGSYDNAVIGSRRVSEVATLSFDLKWVDGNAVLPTFTATQLVDGTLIAATAPTCGWFRTGDTVRKSSPTAGGYSGWICTAGGFPGTWKEFGAIAP